MIGTKDALRTLPLPAKDRLMANGKGATRFRDWDVDHAAMEKCFTNTRFRICSATPTPTAGGLCNCCQTGESCGTAAAKGQAEEHAMREWGS